MSTRTKKHAGTIALSFSAIISSAYVHAATEETSLENRVRALSTELRCLVCQNQTVADSDAPVARDMREQVRQQLAAGKSEDDVKRYMTERFGDFVLYKPPVKASTWILWFAPFIALIAGLLLLLRRLRRPVSAAHSSINLTDEERQRARALLQDP